jgi:hypothetical protein
MKMNYGAGKDICVGMFLPDNTWVDFDLPWQVVGPKLQHFIYADDGKDAAMMLADFHIRVKDRVFSALAGFDYDGASKPQIVWSALGHPYAVCSLMQFTIHDLCYVMNLLERDESDWLMLETLQAFGGNNWVNRNAVWTAVRRLGGASVYPKTAEELNTYKDYVFMTELNRTDGKCLDDRLNGSGVRKSVRPEIKLPIECSEFRRIQSMHVLEGLLS